MTRILFLTVAALIVRTAAAQAPLANARPAALDMVPGANEALLRTIGNGSFYDSPAQQQTRPAIMGIAVGRQRVAGDAPGCQQSRRMLHAQEFYNLRSMHEQYVMAHPVQRLSIGQLTALAHDAAPPKIDADDLRRGQIAWPVALQRQEFADDRARIEQAITLSDADGVRECIAAAGERLAGMVKQLDADRFISAKKFLLGLKLGS